MSVIEEMLHGAVHDGIMLGMSMAIDMLTTAKPDVDAENQTWDTAIAMLNIARDEYAAKSPTPDALKGDAKP